MAQAIAWKALQQLAVNASGIPKHMFGTVCSNVTMEFMQDGFHNCAIWLSCYSICSFGIQGPCRQTSCPAASERANLVSTDVILLKMGTVLALGIVSSVQRLCLD